MYTLILTLVVGYNSSIAHVPNFKTEAACLTAGTAWLKTKFVVEHYTNNYTRSAICVKD